MRALPFVLALAATACGPSEGERAAVARRDALLPKPLSLVAGAGTFTFDAARPVSEQLTIHQPADDPTLGAEGYRLIVTPRAVTIAAQAPAGVFYALQTLEQLLPVVDPAAPRTPRTIAAVEIRDVPRYAWRGVMLDVARHFFSVAAVERYIDLAARYKLNRFHLHLTDDQGWRIEIPSRPELTTLGGATAVDGAPGGYYTRVELQGIIAYGAARFVTVVPEVDMPGHSNAALAADGTLTCDGVAPPPYLGTAVGMSSLCVTRPEVLAFVDDVLDELAVLVPNGAVHLGGDEVATTPPADYATFMSYVGNGAVARGLQPVFWEEAASAALPDGAAVQLWRDVLQPAEIGARPIVLSPAAHTYLDMKYDATTPVGQSWAGFVDVDDAYNWEPDEYGFANVLGIEAALWTETIATVVDADAMIFPRLLGHAELGWSPKAEARYPDYRRRLALAGPRLAALGVGYYRSSLVDWPAP